LRCLMACYITYSKGRRDASFRPSVPSSIRPSVHPSGHPSVPSWSVYSDRAEKEWNTDAARLRIIYISVVKKILIFNFGIFGLRYTHPVSFSPTKRVGLGFFFFFWKFYLEYWKFSMLFTLS
jgi:hypothetical protein